MSLYWIHCNRCCQRPRSPEAKFYVTNCGHLFCHACAAAVHKTKKCGACAVPNVGFVQIGPKMSAETKAGFRNPNDRLQKVFKELEFQVMMYRDAIKGLKGQVKETRDFAKSERSRAERYWEEREELKGALARAEAAAAEARRLQQQQQMVPRAGMAALVPSGSQMAVPDGDSAEKRITLNGRRKAASPGGALFRFPPAGSAAAATAGVSPTGSLTGIVTSPPASRRGGGSNHSLPTATDFAGMEMVDNVFDPRTPAALRRRPVIQPKPPNKGSPGIMNKVSGWLTSL